MFFITSDHVQLHYTDTGIKDKPAILGIPGIGGSCQLWIELIKLFKNSFRFIMLDPRNQGKSERVYKGQRIARHAADVDELLANLNLNNVIGIGNSMGAATFWAYLSQYNQGRLGAIVDLDQSPKMVSDKTWKYGFKKLTWHNYPDYLKLDFGQAFYNHINDKMFALAKAEASKFLYDPTENYKCLIDHAEQDWRDILLSLPVPMLMIAGKNSPYFDYHFVKAVKDINNQITTNIIDDCGHLPQSEQPVIVHDLIMKFLIKQKIV